MSTQNSALPRGASTAHAILVVDDEPQACKWFARLYGDEFVILTATGVDEALALLSEHGAVVAVLLTDYSMPGRNGVDLLCEVRRRHPHVARLLVSACADKDVAMAAVNRGHVEQILEKPLDAETTRQVLREALVASQRRALEQTVIEQRATALRETLGFLAHEVTTPLATVRGYLAAMRDGHRDAPDGVTDMACIEQHKPGDVLFMIEAAQRRTQYAQSLVSTFVHTSRDAYRSEAPVSLLASDLVVAVRDEYPFDAGEAAWLECELAADFRLPGRRDLLYLVLCTLVKNALLALRSALPHDPRLCITLAAAAPAPGLPEQAVIRVSDNGPGVAPHILHRLTHEPVTTRAEAGGSGMGLLFCRRVMASLGGTVDIRSTPGQGASVTLYFPPVAEARA